MRRRAPAAAARRRRAERRGRWAEFLCRVHLRSRGWHILVRDWRCPAGEIDIVARRGRVIAFIEVKSRAGIGTAAVALTPRQRRRIVRAAAAFLALRPELHGLDLRFDVMLVAAFGWPQHWPAAWRADD